MRGRTVEPTGTAALERAEREPETRRCRVARRLTRRLRGSSDLLGVVRLRIWD